MKPQQKSNSEDDVISPKRRKTDHMPARRHIPDEIKIAILARLPVKSVLRFSCVSQTWNALFRTPKFISDHQNNNSSHLVYIRPEERTGKRICTVLGERDGLEKFKYVFPLNNYVVAGVCHGLILIASRKECTKEADSDFGLRQVIHELHYIWNPMTGILKSIGGWEVAEPRHTVVGFGYSERRGDYRAVRMRVTSPVVGRWTYTFEVYSMAADTWTSVEQYCDRPPPLWEGIRSVSVYFQGSIYFLGKSWGSVGHSVMRFDLDEEVFSVIAVLPLERHWWDTRNWREILIRRFAGRDRDKLCWQLAVVGGDRLGLLQAEEGDDRNLHIKAWLLDKESMSWTARTHCVHLPEMVFLADITAAGLLIMEERTAAGERRRLFSYAYDANHVDVDLKLTDLQSSVVGAGTFSINPTRKEASLISIKKESLLFINGDKEYKIEHLND